MSKPTRFPNGINNAVINSALADIGLLDPSRFHKYENDFDHFDSNEWVVTEVEAGAGNAAQAIQDEDGGVLLLTNDDADNDSIFIQLGDGTDTHETFKFVAGKKLAFKTRFKLSDVLQSVIVLGLQITDTSPADVTDGVFFSKADGSAALTLEVEKDNTATSSAVTTLVDDTYITAGFIYNGIDKIDFFVNDVRIGSSVVTNLPDDEELAISFGIENGEAAIKTMSIDYIHVIKER